MIYMIAPEMQYSKRNLRHWLLFIGLLLIYRCPTWIRNTPKQAFLKSLIQQFIHWQVCTVLLVVAFLPYTFLFWRYVFDYGDVRYLTHAVIVHALWGMSCVMISLPLAQTWYNWQLRQARSTSQVEDHNGTEEKFEIEQFPEFPIGSLNIITSIVAALVAFGSPLIKAVASVH
jgi:hypothetical protein